jgi:protein TonB
MNTTANSSFGAPYVLRDPVASKGSRTAPMAIAITVNVLLILGLAKGLGVIHMPTAQTITEAFSVPATVEPKPEVPEIAPPETDVSMASVDVAAPVIAIEPDVVVSVDTHTAISAETTQPTTPSITETPLAEVQLMRRVEPAYPPMSKRMDEQGTVVMRVTVQPNGRVSNVAVVTSSGFQRLDIAARDAVRQWTFARRDGANVAYTVTVPVKFQLDELR